MMTKQRRTFFVDDILHMVMPVNESKDLKRKRSISSDERDKIEDNEEKISKKKFRYRESEYAQVVDIIGDDESTISDDSNNADDHSGKLIEKENDGSRFLNLSIS